MKDVKHICGDGTVIVTHVCLASSKGFDSLVWSKASGWSLDTDDPYYGFVNVKYCPYCGEELPKDPGK